MFTQRRDYLLDMIQQLMERITALLQRAQGQEVALDQLERECEHAMDDEFAELDRRMKGVEPRMVAHLVQPVQRLRAYALLLAARALLQSRRAALLAEHQPSVEPAARRALALVLEVTLASEATSHELEAVRCLFGLVDDDRLSPRYLQALVDLARDPDPED